MLQRAAERGAAGPAGGGIRAEGPRPPALRTRLRAGPGAHPPGLQQQRGLGPLRGQAGRHRLGRRGRPGAEQGEAQRRGAQEQPHHVRGLGHDAERGARTARTRSPEPAARSRRGPAGSARRAAAHFRWGELESVTRSRRLAAPERMRAPLRRRPARPRGRGPGAT